MDSEYPKTFNLDVSDSNSRRGSGYSRGSAQPEAIAQTLHKIRKGSMSTYDSTDSESDVEDAAYKEKMDRRKSCLSMLRRVLA